MESTEQPKPLTNKIRLKKEGEFVVVVFLVVVVVVVVMVLVVVIVVVSLQYLQPDNLITLTTPKQ